jgi:hypothetical protein
MMATLLISNKNENCGTKRLCSMRSPNQVYTVQYALVTFNTQFLCKSLMMILIGTETC